MAALKDHRPALGIIGMGDMGSGIARLLIAHGYPVSTCVAERSNSTKERARSVGAQLVSTEKELVAKCNVILSIVPPKDAVPTADKIRAALESNVRSEMSSNLYYFDLNAIAPVTSRTIAAKFEEFDKVVFLDGGIIGGPPKVSGDEDGGSIWTKPSIVVSGSQSLSDHFEGGNELSQVLNFKSVSNSIGSATGLKMCFAALSKGMTALAIQAFATAYQLDVLEELQTHLHDYFPALAGRAEAGMRGMPPKAYRWSAEMDEIALTMREDGGFDSTLFNEIAKVYDVIANRTLLGQEKIGERKRGMSAEDVAELTAEGLRSTRRTG